MSKRFKIIFFSILFTLDVSDKCKVLSYINKYISFSLSKIIKAQIYFLLSYLQNTQQLYKFT